MLQKPLQSAWVSYICIDTKCCSKFQYNDSHEVLSDLGEKSPFYSVEHIPNSQQGSDEFCLLHGGQGHDINSINQILKPGESGMVRKHSRVRKCPGGDLIHCDNCKGYGEIIAAKISLSARICFSGKVEMPCLYFEQI